MGLQDEVRAFECESLTDCDGVITIETGVNGEEEVGGRRCARPARSKLRLCVE